MRWIAGLVSQATSLTVKFKNTSGYLIVLLRYCSATFDNDEHAFQCRTKCEIVRQRQKTKGQYFHRSIV